MADARPSIGEFLIWLLLGTVTLGIYTIWWQYSRLEAIYRKAIQE